MPPNLIEITCNIGLGAALQAIRHEWEADSKSVLAEMTSVLDESKSFQPDVLVRGRNMPHTVIETSFDENDANEDALKRLGRHTSEDGLPILTAIAVYLDESYKSLHSAEQVKLELLNARPLRYALYQQIDVEPGAQRIRWPRNEFITGTVFDLAYFISTESIPKQVMESVAESVATKIKQAANRFKHSVEQSVLEELKGVLQQQSQLSALHTSMVLWLNAIIVQNQLRRDGNPVANAFSLRDSMAIKPSKVQESWNLILESNWYSVFQPAVSVLTPYIEKDIRATSEALGLLLEAAEEIEISQVGSQLNVGAELFPKLADDRKESAAYYTQPPAAELLSGLTIQETDLSPDAWANPDVLRQHSVADFACGTGTLLRAGYRRIQSFFERYNRNDHSESDSFHKNAIEQGLIGSDISPIAAHLTTASLAIMNLRQTYSKTRIGWLAVGGPTAATGSLEYLKSDHATDLFDQIGSVSVGDRQAVGEKELAVRDESVDWILMNPPYTRTRGKLRSFDVAGIDEITRHQCQKRWGKLIENLPAIKTAGMAASFLVLAKKKIKPGGRIGFVLPLTAAFANSWQKTRAMVLEEFHDVIAVAVAGGQALGRHALSADTGMEEMLLIASRNYEQRTSSDSSSIYFVTLDEAVNSVGKAAEIARAILKAKSEVQAVSTWKCVQIGGDTIGHLSLRGLRQKTEPWSPLGASNPRFSTAVDLLTRGTLAWGLYRNSLGLTMTTIEDLFHVGPTHDSIGYPVDGDRRGAFEIHELIQSDSLLSPDLCLWSADADTQQQLLVLPTHKALPRSDRHSPDDEEKIRQSQSTLLYARNMRWTSQSLLCATTTRAVIGGSSWTTLRHDRKDIFPAFALWANSTLGMIVHWSQGQRTQTGRSRTQIQTLREIPAPDFNQISPQGLRKAKQHFEVLQDQKLLPAYQAHQDPVRERIDDAVIDVMSLPSEAKQIVQELRYFWCSEPSVHGYKKGFLGSDSQ